jgi:uncharacterized protein YcfL
MRGLNMKKWLVIVILVLASFSLVGCNKSEDNDPNDEPIVANTDNVLEVLAEKIKEVFLD